MIMQVLVSRGRAVFSITIADSIMAFGISAIAPVALIPVVITVGTFKLAEHKPAYSNGEKMVIVPRERKNVYDPQR